MINQNLANYSNDFIALALIAYFFAFSAYCGEWAFGSRSRFGQVPHDGRFQRAGGSQRQSRGGPACSDHASAAGGQERAHRRANAAGRPRYEHAQARQGPGTWQRVY